MPKVRQAARRDNNHTEIVGVFATLGCSWLDLASIGGALDGLLGVAGIDQRVEIKNPEVDSTHRKLTPAEKKVFEEWRGRKPVIVQTDDDAINLVNSLRRRAP